MSCKSPIMAGTQRESGGLGALGVRLGFELYPEDAETPGGSGAAGSHSPPLPWGSALPMSGCGRCLWPLERAGGSAWGPAGRLSGEGEDAGLFLLTVPLLALLGAPLTPVPAATPPTREAQFSQAYLHERGLQPCSGSSGPSHSPCAAWWPFPVAAGLWADSRSLSGVSALLSCVNTPGLHGPSEDPGVFSAFRRKPI